MATETVELHKLKLAELKQECLARGLETKGIKQDLINRLQAYLEEHAEEEANEEDVLGDETEEEEPKPLELPVKEEEPPEKTVDVAAEKKVVKITSEIPQTERMQKRAERFNVPVSLESKKAARAARFGISPVPSKGLSSDTKPMVNMDKLKERAQRTQKTDLRQASTIRVPQHPPAILRLLSARLLTISCQARSLPPPQASPSNDLVQPGSHLPQGWPHRPARLSFRLAPSSWNAGSRDLTTAPPSAPPLPPLRRPPRSSLASKSYSRLYAPPRPTGSAHPRPTLRCVPAPIPAPSCLVVEIRSRTAVLPSLTHHLACRPRPQATPPCSLPRGLSSIAPPKGLSLGKDLSLGKGRSRRNLPSPSKARSLGPVRPTRPALARARTRSLHISQLGALGPQVAGLGPGPASKPDPAPHAGSRASAPTLPSLPPPPPPPAPRSHGARSPPARSFLPPTLCPTLPSFVPGARNRFPASAARPEEGAATEELPLAAPDWGTVTTKAMSYYLNSENHLDSGPIYVRENGQLHMVNLALDDVRSSLQKPRPFRLFPKGFSVELCMNREDDTAQKEKTDHFIFTYTREGNLRYSAKSLFSLVLGFISDNVDHIDSLIGFPEQIAEKLFSAAEARQKFTEPGAGLRALQKFTEAYGSLVLCSLCLRNRYLVISEKLEEIKSFRELTCLDLSCCKLGDEHELLEHLTNEALSSVTQLRLKDNCLSDAGVRKMTAPVRVMKRGLENLSLLDLSCNPEITDAGIGYLFSFRKLNCLDISGTGLKDIKAVKHKLQTHIGLVHSKVPLKEFDHSNCKTEGWADQIVLQWERVTLEAMKPQETLESRTAAHHFYGKRARTEALGKYPLTEAHMTSSEKLQFYKEKAADCHGPLSKHEALSSQESKKGKKRAFEEPEKEQSSSSQSSKQKYVCLAVEDWDLLNSY